MGFQIIHISMIFSHKSYGTAYSAYSQLSDTDTLMCSEEGLGYMGILFL